MTAGVVGSLVDFAIGYNFACKEQVCVAVIPQKGAPDFKFVQVAAYRLAAAASPPRFGITGNNDK